MSIRNILDTAQYIIKVKDIQINTEEDTDNYIPSLYNSFREITNRLDALEIANPSGWYGDFIVNYTTINYITGTSEANLLVCFFNYDDDEVQLVVANNLDTITTSYTNNIDIDDRVIGYSYNLFINNTFVDANTILQSASFSEPEIIFNGTETKGGVEYQKYLIPLHLYGSQINYNVVVDAQQGFGGAIVINWTGTCNESAIGFIEFAFEADDGSYQSRGSIVALTPIGSQSDPIDIIPPLPKNKNLLIYIEELHLYNVVSLLCTETTVIFNGIITIPSLPNTLLYSFTIPTAFNLSILTFNLITTT
jgi:hypothetical protein